MDKFLIIADDFTGANDAGVKLSQIGFETTVCFKYSDKSKFKSLVLDTESRVMGAKVFEKRYSELIKPINFARFDFVLKKIDSTLRGRIAEEIKIVDHYYDSPIIFFAPSLPGFGRTTENAVQKLNGVPLTETELNKDPKNPVEKDNLILILKEEYDEAIIHISDVFKENDKLSYDKNRIFVFDSKTDYELDEIVRLGIKSGRKILYIGTSALSQALAKQVYKQKKVLGVVASLSSVCQEQLLEAQKKDIIVYPVSISDFYKNDIKLLETAKEIAKLFKLNDKIIVCSSSSLSKTERTKIEAFGKRNRLSNIQIANYYQKLLSSLCLLIMKEVEISALFLTGGDTAIAVLKALKITGARIISELEPGIPKMTITGGIVDNLPIVTKAGGFGNKDSIINIMDNI